MRAPPRVLVSLPLFALAACTSPAPKGAETGATPSDTTDTGADDSGVDSAADTTVDDTGDSAVQDTALQDTATEDADGDGFTPADGDCDDASAAVHPGAEDGCDGVDDDCDGLVDAGWNVPEHYADIGAALAAATGGERICVAAGVWPENLDFLGKDVVVESIEGALLTSIEGDGTGPVVRFGSGEGPGAELRGFTISGGYADAGAGISVEGASPTLVDLVVSGNFAYDNYDAAGAGIRIEGGSAELVRVDVIGNYVYADRYDAEGGGLYVHHSTAWLTDVRIRGNHAEGGWAGSAEGAGLFVEEGTVYARRLEVVGNAAGGSEGIGVGVALENADLVGTNVVVAGNSARYGGIGAGVYVRAGHLGLRNATIVGNDGGASPTGAGGIHLSDATATLVNVALTGNAGDGTGDGLYASGSATAAFRYADLYGNAPVDVGGVDDPVGTDGNVAVDPGYADVSAASPLAWDLTLAAGSALVDAGQPDLLDGDGTIGDIGAYGGPDASAGEDGAGCAPIAWYADVDRDGFGAGTPTDACAWPGPGWGASDEDCDDADAATHPIAAEACDGVDQDCDGIVDSAACLESLGTADGALYGEELGQSAGDVVAAVGDVDGDGIGDLVVASRSWDGAAGYQTGVFWLVSGPIVGDTPLAAAGARMEGPGAYDMLGWAMSPAGDGDGDGYADFWVTELGHDGAVAGGGAALLFRGPLSGTLVEADATFAAQGEDVGGALGSAVAGDFDADGDGVTDLLVSGSSLEANAGAVFLLLDAAGATGARSVGDADATLEGESAADLAGRALSAGDLDGDGLAELILGASGVDAGAGTGAGAAYVVYGPPSGVVSLADADGRFTGNATRLYAGWALASLGDVDGDGLGDVIVGELGGGAGGEGAAWLVLGPATGSDTLAGAGGAQIVGGAADDRLGSSLTATGDFDGDGFADVAVGATDEATTGTGAGAVYLFAGPLSGTVGVADAARVLYGEGAGNSAGTALSAADLDGDGAPELVVGAPDTDIVLLTDGAIYVLGL